MLLDQIDALDTQIDTLTTRIDELLAELDPARVATTGARSRSSTREPSPARALRTRRSASTEIPGIGPEAAQVILAEIGLDMTRFPTAAAPGVVGQAVPAHHPVRAGDTAAARPARATPT